MVGSNLTPGGLLSPNAEGGLLRVNILCFNQSNATDTTKVVHKLLKQKLILHSATSNGLHATPVKSVKEK
jgi:hypothetical protein